MTMPYMMMLHDTHNVHQSSNIGLPYHDIFMMKKMIAKKIMLLIAHCSLFRVMFTMFRIMFFIVHCSLFRVMFIMFRIMLFIFHCSLFRIMFMMFRILFFIVHCSGCESSLQSPADQFKALG